MSMELTYEEFVNPDVTGVYACRVPMLDRQGEPTGMAVDVFLMWFEGRWCHTGSDQFFRGEVLGWIGPLPRIR